MLKRFTSFMLILLLSFTSVTLAEDDDSFFVMDGEEDISILDTIEVEETETAAGVVDTDGSTTITITCTGDFTIGEDNYHRKGKKFKDELKNHGNDINFTMENMRSILQQDDMTLVNFEGTFTNTKYVPDSKKGNSFLFNIDPAYAYVLPQNSIEAVSLANNHVMDHGTEGYEDTKKTLDDVGVKFSTSEDIGLFSVKGITIAMLSYLCIDRRRI